MIIVLKPHTNDESIKKIEDVIRSKGAVPHVSKGDIQTIIGMVEKYLASRQEKE